MRLIASLQALELRARMPQTALQRLPNHMLCTKKYETGFEEPRRTPKSFFDRDTVLDAAVRVFWEKSYEGTSLDDLTTAMGINRSSIYATFGKKHDPFLAAIDRYAAVQGMAQSAPLRDEPSIKDAVGGYCRQIVKTVSSGDSPRGCLIGSVATEVAERDPVVREKIAGNLFHSEPCDVWRSKSRAWIGLRGADTILGALAPFMAWLAWRGQGARVWGLLIAYNAVGAFDYSHGLLTQWLEPTATRSAALTFGSIGISLNVQLVALLLLSRGQVASSFVPAVEEASLSDLKQKHSLSADHVARLAAN